ncbi:hypothetical protein KVV02_000654 [Mortierella alpina]|uniref:Uncharacterized protein n=1 Tax=Mortierella alpina TaxID=64518 RepID=A0A9P8D0C3_MORAP|nr:hypothetical protein KVV02_000654 [Mortierella alpina]
MVLFSSQWYWMRRDMSCLALSMDPIFNWRLLSMFSHQVYFRFADSKVVLLAEVTVSLNYCDTTAAVLLISLALMVIVEGQVAPNATFDIQHTSGPLSGAPKVMPELPKIPTCWDKVQTDNTFTISCDEPAWYAWADCDRQRYTSPQISGSYRIRVTCVSPIEDCGAYEP